MRIPDNAKGKADYTGYICNDGYKKGGEGCIECSPGSYCVGGVAIPCKRHYYSDELGSAKCKRCKTFSDCTGSDCGDNIAAVREKSGCGYAPLLCAGGSNQNSDCVSCGQCGGRGDAKTTGLSCVNEYEMDGLPQLDPV